MNMGYEDDELKPYQEAQPDLNDQKRIGKTGTVQQHTNIFFHILESNQINYFLIDTFFFILSLTFRHVSISFNRLCRNV